MTAVHWTAEVITPSAVALVLLGDTVRPGWGMPAVIAGVVTVGCGRAAGHRAGEQGDRPTAGRPARGTAATTGAPGRGAAGPGPARRTGHLVGTTADLDAAGSGARHCWPRRRWPS